ncbi:hypothetical protein ACJMK2_015876 [Sinanodonta woodiana]|uniref:Uncharacterized protein n=1 Tax=Sinanodonta woodiana TaxID=1069815 RepID=A0ABD3UUN1_SINWO
MFYFYFLISYSLFINAIPPVEAYDFCQYDYGVSSYYRSKYCDKGCCGSKNSSSNSVCCTSNTVTQVPSTNPYGPVGYGYSGFGPPPAYYPFNNVPQGGTNPAYPPPPAANY